MKVPIQLTVNGKPYRSEVEPRLLLVHYLRDVLELTGTHVGCETGLCGACTVHLDGQAVKSCLVLAVQADGCTVKTVEALASNGELDPLQQGFREEHGLQCGFCTPGMLMAAHDLLRRSPHPTATEIQSALRGNLCRCTGYQMIVAAVQNAAKKMRKSEPRPNPSRACPACPERSRGKQSRRDRQRADINAPAAATVRRVTVRRATVRRGS